LSEHILIIILFGANPFKPPTSVHIWAFKYEVENRIKERKQILLKKEFEKCNM
jgi:hypothetical protein